MSNKNFRISTESCAMKFKTRKSARTGSQRLLALALFRVALRSLLTAYRHSRLRCLSTPSGQRAYHSPRKNSQGYESCWLLTEPIGGILSRMDMPQTMCCVFTGSPPVEHHNRFELSLTVWRTAVLPLHQWCAAPERFERSLAVSTTLTDLESAVVPFN